MTRSSGDTRRFGTAGQRLAARYWIMRPYALFAKLPFLLAGWFAGSPDGRSLPVGTALGLLGLAGLIHGTTFVLNDLFDAEKDRITAPNMPIPSGLITRRGAAIQAGGHIAVGSTLYWRLCSSATQRVAVLGCVFVGLVVTWLYSQWKAAGAALLFGGLIYLLPVYTGWVLGGGRSAMQLFLLIVIVTLHGAHANCLAQLRDVQLDPVAGNRTLAVRVGANRMLVVAMAVRVAEWGAIAALAMVADHAGALVWIAAPVLLLVLGLPRLRLTTESDRTSQSRSLMIWVYVSFLTESALLAVFHTKLAAACTAALFVWFQVEYRRYNAFQAHVADQLHESACTPRSVAEHA